MKLLPKIKPFILFLVGLVVLLSCREDFLTTQPYSTLSFSKDTVFLDTVFSTIGSSTYQLKVYNKSNQDITIPVLELGKGNQSLYRLNVDGISGKSFDDVSILAKDSIYVFIETTIDYQDITNPIYMDSIVFRGGDAIQNVKLVTLVQDAHFLFPTKDAQGLKETITLGVNSSGKTIAVTGFYLNDDTVFSNDKPYVIYGYCAVPNTKTLTIEAGAKIHFHQNSGLIIEENAQLIIAGSLNDKVVMEGDRLEPEFSNLPGQWGGVWLRAGSFDNQIDHALIKNATIGILIDSIGSTTAPTLVLNDTEIYNSSSFGLLGRTAKVNGSNLVINNSGQSSLALTMGGSYDFKHSTFTNYWYRGFREYPSVLINNYYSYVNNNVEQIIPRKLEKANFTNCIIDGSNFTEFLLDRVDGASFNYYFANNSIKYNEVNGAGPTELYDFNNESYYFENLINPSNDFKAPESNQLIIGDLSESIGKASIVGTQSVPQDILGVTRSLPADIGAYQHIVFDRKN